MKSSCSDFIFVSVLCTQVFCFRIRAGQKRGQHHIDEGSHAGFDAFNQTHNFIDHAASNQVSPTMQTQIDHTRHLDVMEPNRKDLDVKRFLAGLLAFAIFSTIFAGVLIFGFRRKAKRSNRKVEEPAKDVCKSEEQESAHHSKRGQNIRLALLWIVCMLMNCHYSYSNQFSAYRQSLQEAYHLSDSTASSVYTALNTGGLFFSFVPGWLFDRYGLAMTGVFSAAVSVCSIFLLKFNVATWWVPFCFLLFGFAQTCFQVIGLVCVLTTFPEEYAGTASVALLLCISLGVTVHTLVFDKVCHKKWEAYEQYIIFYSIVTAALGMMASMLVKKREDPSSGGTVQVVCTADQLVGEREDLAEPEDEVNEMCEAATEVFAHSFAYASMMTSIAAAVSNLERPKLRYQLVSLPFAFQMLVHGTDLAFGFSFLGAVATAAMSVGMEKKQVTSFVGTLGLVCSLGRLLLGLTCEITVRYSKVFSRYFFFFVAYLLTTVSLFLLVRWPKLLPACACLITFSWGGTMSLAPGAIRAEFGAKLAGRIYGLLHTLVSFSFILWDCRVPESAEASFSPWFTVAATAMSVNLVASLLMWIRSMRTDSTLSTK